MKKSLNDFAIYSFIIYQDNFVCYRGKITCPGARDKLNFRQDKHIFSPNVRRGSKKFSASLFDNILRTS